MAIIGINSSSGLSYSIESGNTLPQRLMDGFGTYVAGAGEEVFRFGAFLGASVGDGSGVTFFVFDITSGTNGASLVAQGTLASLTPSVLNTLDITPVALTEGNTYAVGWKVNSATQVTFVRAYEPNAVSNESLTGADAVPSTWSDSGTLSQRYGVYAETQASSVTTYPHITDTLIDLNGDPVANEAGLTVLVWYAEPTGAPDEEHTSVTTDVSGNLSVALTGTPLEDDPAWIVVYKDGTPYRMTAVKTAVVYA